MNEPKKSLGQHWLFDDSALTHIVEAADISDGQTVFEIGPGLGTLTHKLVQKGAQVIALEFDEELLTGLQKKFAGNSLVTVVHGDVRKFNLNTLPAGYKIVANIPYYLTSVLVRQLSEAQNKPETAALLVQKEVAERICAAPGAMSLLSVVAQWYFDCSLGDLVPAKLFTPPPKIDSQVVVLRKKVPEQLDEKSFFRVVKAGFSERRKTLANSLSGGLRRSKDEVTTVLKRIGVEPNRRAQTLSIDEWVLIYKNFSAVEV